MSANAADAAACLLVQQSCGMYTEVWTIGVKIETHDKVTAGNSSRLYVNQYEAYWSRRRQRGAREPGHHRVYTKRCEVANDGFDDDWAVPPCSLGCNTRIDRDMQGMLLALR